MESTTLGGTVRGVARAEVRPACREGRVVRLRGRVLEVTVRSLTGDVKTMPARCYRPRVVEGAGGLELLDAVKNDPVWVAEDEGQQLVVVDWEPKG